jgi:hypothetical protein
MTRIQLGVMRWVSLGVAAVAIGMPVLAHHSVSGQFDVKKKVVLTGTVERVDWVNPHIYMHLKVTDAAGASAVWRLGSVPVGMARAAGVTKDDFLARGQTVKVTAYPARDGTKNLGFLTRIDYPDGHYVALSPDRE